MPDPSELLGQARKFYQMDRVLSALRLAEEAVALEPDLAGAHSLRAQCLAGLGRWSEALAAVENELRLDPRSKEAAALRQNILSATAQLKAKSGGERKWESGIPKEVLQPIEQACHRYTYRGHAMIKNPFDLALYPLLLWNLKPATIFEIGSYNGASALWMADLLRTYQVPASIHSIDLVAVTAIKDPDITYYAGSGRELETHFPADRLANMPRPFLVIEDADHTYKTSKAVFDHFHPHLVKGEYFVIEDGMTAEGPRKAIAEFLAAHPTKYDVDTEYCDFFGYNATWCMNGFIRRVA